MLRVTSHGSFKRERAESPAKDSSTRSRLREASTSSQVARLRFGDDRKQPNLNQAVFDEMKRVRLDELITQKQAAEIRGVTPQSIHLLVKRGRLKTVQIGGRQFLLRSDVEKFEPDPGGRPKKKQRSRKKSS